MQAASQEAFRHRGAQGICPTEGDADFGQVDTSTPTVGIIGSAHYQYSCRPP